jgi:hypothetical protein
MDTTRPDSSVVGKVIYKYNEKNNLVEQPNIIQRECKGIYTIVTILIKKAIWIRQKKMQDGSMIDN